MSFLFALSVEWDMTRREIDADAEFTSREENTWFHARIPCCEKSS